MTTPESPEREVPVAAAWREHSTETPSPQLDAAILAAAHRAVRSAPQDAAQPAREAARPQRWWMPLAAAATVGAVALGILQVVPPGQPVTAPSVSDIPASGKVGIDALQQERKEAPRAVSGTSRVREARDAGRAHVLEESATPQATPSVPAPTAVQPAAKVVAPVAADSAASAVAPMAAAPPRVAASASAVDIDAAIVRIRKLYDDGKLADAAKELVALRAVAVDADQRLPPELRTWAATVKP